MHRTIHWENPASDVKNDIGTGCSPPESMLYLAQCHARAYFCRAGIGLQRFRERDRNERRTRRIQQRQRAGRHSHSRGEARTRGVEVLCRQCEVTQEGIEISGALPLVPA